MDYTSEVILDMKFLGYNSCCKLKASQDLHGIRLGYNSCCKSKASLDLHCIILASLGKSRVKLYVLLQSSLKLGCLVVPHSYL